jgi:hypothetical protein
LDEHLLVGSEPFHRFAEEVCFAAEIARCHLTRDVTHRRHGRGPLELLRGWCWIAAPS